MMRPKIIEECRKKMYDAIWLEIDRDPQRPAVARVDITTPAGSICTWCDPMGNLASISHKQGNNESERLEEAIEGCLNFEDVWNDYLQECPECIGQGLSCTGKVRLSETGPAYAGIDLGYFFLSCFGRGGVKFTRNNTLQSLATLHVLFTEFK